MYRGRVLRGLRGAIRSAAGYPMVAMPSGNVPVGHHDRRDDREARARGCCCSTWCVCMFLVGVVVSQCVDFFHGKLHEGVSSAVEGALCAAIMICFTSPWWPGGCSIGGHGVDHGRTWQCTSVRAASVPSPSRRGSPPKNAAAAVPTAHARDWRAFVRRDYSRCSSRL